MNRRDKHNYYLDIAETVIERGTCLRRNFGCILVNHDQIISTGYTGAPRGRANCSDLNRCIRTELNIPRGERYEICRSVHAEANAIISASREKMIGGSAYLVGREVSTGEYIENANSCSMCKRLLINAGIKEIYIRDTKDEYRKIEINEWIENDDSLDGKGGY